MQSEKTYTRHRSLNPGGTFEIHDILYPMESDDGTLRPEHALDRWSKLMMEAFGGFGQPVDSALRYEQQLTEAGFVDVVVVKEKWPTNRWPRDQKYKQIGRWAPNFHTRRWPSSADLDFNLDWWNMGFPTL